MNNFQEYCIEIGKKELLEQWSPRNGELKPADVAAGTRKKVWWVCPKGHEWEAEVVSRVHTSDCPICSGRKVLAGYNDLGTRFPAAAAEWNYEKNGRLKPSDVLAFSNRKVWWICPKGHEYPQQIANKTFKNAGCPYCSSRKILAGFNDLEALYPHLASEWHPSKNSLKPSEVSPGSMRKVWWICPEGHEYETSIYSRAKLHTACPVCANHVIVPEENSLAVLFPQIASEWHPEKNGGLKPENVSVGCNSKAWWRCALGHEWTANINDRTSKNTACPYCMNKKVLSGFNDLATTYPKIASQWHPELNGKLTPEMVTYGANQRVWWICEEGHIWKTKVQTRTVSKCGCPICAGRVGRGKKRYYENIEAVMKERNGEK